MTLMIYDGSFEGWLTAVFDIYEYRYQDVSFSTDANYQKSLFAAVHEVATEDTKSKRVWKGLEDRLSRHALAQLYKSFLSEVPGIENIMLQYTRYAFSSRQTIEHNYSDPTVLTIVQTAKKVHREKHRMEAFVRFQLTKDQLYYAVISPDFNVLPLIAKHFKSRYADQSWIIYDAHRKYGLYYDLEQVSQVAITFEAATEQGKSIRPVLDESEDLFQTLWRQYFSSVNIASRKNLKLHIQHMPKRYWRYLPEKKTDNGDN